MSNSSDRRDSPFNRAFHGEMLPRLAALRGARGKEQVLDLLRPSDFEAFMCRALANAASCIADTLSQVYHDAYSHSGAGRQHFIRLAPQLPTANELHAELVGLQAPFLAALAVMQREYQQLTHLNQRAPMVAFTDAARDANIGLSIGGGLLGPIGSVVGGAVGGYLGGIRVSQQLGQYARQLDVAFEQVVVAWDLVATRSTQQLGRSIDKTVGGIEAALREAERRAVVEEESAKLPWWRLGRR